MSSTAPFTNLSLTDFRAAKPEPVSQLSAAVDRLQTWLARKSRARLAVAERVVLRRRWPEDQGRVLTLDCEKQTTEGHLARLRAAADGSIDTVTTVGALAAAVNVEIMLADIKRVLRPQGRLIFVEPVAARAGTRLRRLQRILDSAFRLLVGCANAPRDLWNDLNAARFGRLMFDSVNLAGVGGLPVPHLVGEAVLTAGGGSAVARPRGRAVGVPRLAWREPASAFFGR